ncbi:serine/threonine-protein kinase [Microcoleus sp. FACHB-672]|uniref:serine/threonine-protein kinase n=1 Tax=Microcoleus sp. FACHB-672 TaxID=2692825 RepID=UPI0018F05069|nr:serine/threonine-protein kinase [Microcoleus sp. FACHB-672]
MLLGRYRGIRLLGKGGFGKTFEIDDAGTSKVLKVLLTNYHKAVELFQREAEVLRHLDHPGIPKVESEGYFTWKPKNRLDPVHCLVMEKIAGENLEKWLRDQGNQPITTELAINWLKQLLEILAQVHQKQCLHRDIKPANIMLTPTGQLALIDFGAVREVTDTYLIKVEGQDVTQLVSRGYTPPEQYEGAAVFQSDFYALGRTFIHLLTGKHPCDPALKDPQSGEFNWRNHAPAVSKGLADLIDHLIAPSPQERPQNTQVILQELKACQSPWLRFIHKGKYFKFAALLLLGLLGIRLGLQKIAFEYNELGVQHYFDNQPTQALEKYNFALKLDPNYGEVYYNRGGIYEDLRDFERARIDYQAAAKAGVPEAYNNLARLYILNKDYTAAVDLIGQGMKLPDLTPNNKYTLHKNLGWARLGQQRYAEAQEQLQIAIDLAPESAAAHCLLAQVLEAQGEQKKALEEWKSCQRYALEGSSDEDTWKGMAEQRIKQAGKKK